MILKKELSRILLYIIFAEQNYLFNIEKIRFQFKINNPFWIDGRWHLTMYLSIQLTSLLS